jgi:phosphoribosylanthranilate isomerase
MIPVKICGITSVKNAQIAIENGASAIGLIFYKSSPRNIDVKLAKEIVKYVNGSVPIVGIFIDETIQKLKSILLQVNLDILQLHGNESPQYCEQFNLPIIKVFRVCSGFDKSQLFDYNVSAFLFDTYKKELHGGTGESFNWELISSLKIDTPIILSGGLTPENIIDGIDMVNPSAIDLNSGLENSPGKKSVRLIKKLFRKVEITKHKENIFHKIKVGTFNV